MYPSVTPSGPKPPEGPRMVHFSQPQPVAKATPPARRAIDWTTAFSINRAAQDSRRVMKADLSSTPGDVLLRTFVESSGQDRIDAAIEIAIRSVTSNAMLLAPAPDGEM